MCISYKNVYNINTKVVMIGCISFFYGSLCYLLKR